MRLLLVVLIVLILIGGLLFFRPGGYLIVDQPEKSDAIAILGGDQVDLRYSRGLELLRAGYGKNLIVDVVPGEVYGHSTVDLAQDYVAKSGPERPPGECLRHPRRLYQGGGSTGGSLRRAVAACVPFCSPGF